MSTISIAKLEIMSGIIVADLDPNVAIPKDMTSPGNPIMVIMIRMTQINKSRPHNRIFTSSY